MVQQGSRRCARRKARRGSAGAGPWRLPEGSAGLGVVEAVGQPQSLIEVGLRLWLLGGDRPGVLSKVAEQRRACLIIGCRPCCGWGMEAVVERGHFGAGLLILRHPWRGKESNAGDPNGPNRSSIEVPQCTWSTWSMRRHDHLP